MKKKLEAELISIAHRILKLKNKSDVVLLHQVTQQLYEKLSVLRFVEEHFAEAKPTIGHAEIQEKLEAAFENEATSEQDTMPLAENELEIPVMEEAFEPTDNAPEVLPTEDTEEVEPEITPQIAVEVNTETTAEAEEEIAEQVHEAEETPEEVTDVPAEINEEPVFTPATETFKPDFEPTIETKMEETKTEETKPELIIKPTQFSFEDLLGNDYVDPIFVKPEELEKKQEQKELNTVIPVVRIEEEPIAIAPKSINDNDMKSVSLNDRLSKGIEIGLNDRIAFLKHLFANSSEDYNRVLSQLITFDTFEEARDFIDEMVKPDYNNWDGKEEYSIRFIEIIEKRFS